MSSVGLLNRAGVSLIPIDSPTALAQDLVIRDFNTNTLLDSFAPDPATGGLRVPIVEDETLLVTTLNNHNAHLFLQTADRLVSEGWNPEQSPLLWQPFSNGVVWKASAKQSSPGQVLFKKTHGNFGVQLLREQLHTSDRLVRSGWLCSDNGDYWRGSLTMDIGDNNCIHTKKYEFCLGTDHALFSLATLLGINVPLAPVRSPLRRELRRHLGIGAAIPSLQSLAVEVGRLIYASGQYRIPDDFEVLDIYFFTFDVEKPSVISLPPEDLKKLARMEELSRFKEVDLYAHHSKDELFYVNVDMDVDYRDIEVGIYPLRKKGGGLMPLAPKLRETLWKVAASPEAQ